MASRENESTLLVENRSQNTSINNENKKYPGLGIILGAASGICYACCSLLLRLTAGKVNPELFTVFRGIDCFFLTLPYVLYKRYNIFGRGLKNNVLLIVQGLLSAATISTQYKAFQMIHLGDANAILSTTCAFIVIINCMFELKLCSCLDLLTVISCITGVVLCSQPTFIFGKNMTYDREYYLGIGVAMISAVIWAFEYVNIDALRSEASVTALANFFGPIIPLSLYMIVEKIFTFPSTLYENGLLHLNAVLSLFSTLFMIVGMEYDNPLLISVGKSSDIVVSLIFDVLIFGDTLTVASICGAILILLTIIMQSSVKVWTNRDLYYREVSETEGS